MTTDAFAAAWNTASHGRLVASPVGILAEVRRRDHDLRSTILWRDISEIGACIVFIALWAWLGQRLALPWSWYLGIPASLWTAGFILVSRWRHRPPADQHNLPLGQALAQSAHYIRHQAWLLRYVFWWYILPDAIAASIFFVHVGWLASSRPMVALTVVTLCFAVIIAISLALWRINQRALNTELLPRLSEVEALMADLNQAPAQSHSKDLP